MSEKIRVLEALGEPFSYGGQEAFIMNVLGHMDRSEIEADILTPYYCDNPHGENRIRSWGGRVYVLNCDFKPGHLRKSAEEPIRKFLSEHSYDVIHIHSGSNSMLEMYARLAYKAGIPHIIVHSHCTGKAGLKHAAVKLLTSFSLRKYPDDYCACSQEAAEWRFPHDICRQSVRILNNGIDLDCFSFNESIRKEMRNKLGLDDDTTVIINVGRLTYQKNQSFLLDIMHMIRAGNRDDQTKYKLLLVGDGEDRDMLIHKAEELGISNDVIFTGAVPDPQNYMQAADVAAMPSRYEGLAIAVVEAQASGLDVIAADVIPKLAAPTESVRFISTEDQEAWVKALTEDHSRHPDQTNLLKAEGFSIDCVAEEVREMYTSCQRNKR